MRNLFLTATLLVTSQFILLSCKKQGNKDPRCAMQPETGLCTAAFQRFYFDQESQTCKSFIWGGCGGVVPFETLQECEDCDCAK